MSNGHTTSAVARPRAGTPRVRAARLDDGHPHADRTRVRERPIDDDRQLVTARPHRWLVGMAGIAIVTAIVAALFVLPVQAWLRQKDEILQKQQELAVLTEANRRLGIEVDHLATPEGAKEAAREELGVVGPGEARMSVLPTETGPLPLPAGWPYDTFNQIVTVRQTVSVDATTP